MMQWRTSRNNQDIITQDVYSDVKTSSTASDFSSRSEVQEYDLESIQEKLGLAESQIQAESVVSTPDTMPSSQTLNMSYERQYSAQAKTGSKMDSKIKVMIAGYTFVVLALILVVTFCSVSVGGSFGVASALNSEYATVVGEVASVTEQVQTEDYVALIEKATELGYIDASNSNTLTYTEIETRPAQNFNIESNWFDSLCDWFSGVFGG